MKTDQRTLSALKDLSSTSLNMISLLLKHAAQSEAGSEQERITQTIKSYPIITSGMKGLMWTAYNNPMAITQTAGSALKAGIKDLMWTAYNNPMAITQTAGNALKAGMKATGSGLLAATKAMGSAIVSPVEAAKKTASAIMHPIATTQAAGSAILSQLTPTSILELIQNPDQTILALINHPDFHESVIQNNKEIFVTMLKSALSYPGHIPNDNSKSIEELVDSISDALEVIRKEGMLGQIKSFKDLSDISLTKLLISASPDSALYRVTDKLLHQTLTVAAEYPETCKTLTSRMLAPEGLELDHQELSQTFSKIVATTPPKTIKKDQSSMIDCAKMCQAFRSKPAGARYFFDTTVESLFHGKNLSNTDLAGPLPDKLYFDDFKFTNATLGPNFPSKDAMFTNCDFSNATINTGIILSGCTMDEKSFSSLVPSIKQALAHNIALALPNVVDSKNQPVDISTLLAEHDIILQPDNKSLSSSTRTSLTKETAQEKSTANFSEQEMESIDKGLKFLLDHSHSTTKLISDTSPKHSFGSLLYKVACAMSPTFAKQILPESMLGKFITSMSFLEGCKLLFDFIRLPEARRFAQESATIINKLGLGFNKPANLRENLVEVFVKSIKHDTAKTLLSHQNTAAILLNSSKVFGSQEDIKTTLKLCQEIIVVLDKHQIKDQDKLIAELLSNDDKVKKGAIAKLSTPLLEDAEFAHLMKHVLKISNLMDETARKILATHTQQLTKPPETHGSSIHR